MGFSYIFVLHLQKLLSLFHETFKSSLAIIALLIQNTFISLLYVMMLLLFTLLITNL